MLSTKSWLHEWDWHAAKCSELLADPQGTAFFPLELTARFFSPAVPGRLGDAKVWGLHEDL